MKTFSLFFLFIILLSCSTDSQNNSVKKADSIYVKKDAPEIVKFTSFEIDSVPDIKTGTNERSAAFIEKRLKELIGRSYKKRCEDIGVRYPPKYVLFRTFKLEEEFEIWVSDKRSDTLSLLATLPICAVDNEPGTKLKQGDGKTPEGFYTCKILYGSSNGFMWIKLNNSELDDYGTVQYGSSFKLCLEYPLPIDRNRTRKFSGNYNPGSAICVHGNCVTAGCISFESKNFLPIFLSSKFHDTNKYGYPKIHIFPFRFTDKLKEEKSKEVYSDMKPEDIVNFWEEIETAYTLFKKNHKAIKVSFSNNKYHFIEY
ncbi:MAG: hypothetical protein L3J35_04200 [Bacteroidales bacterium]|nr:hypothetical protein [Bacteroidales bacterium]